MQFTKTVNYSEVADQVNVENIILYRVKSAKDDVEFDIQLKPTLSMKEVSMFVGEVIDTLHDVDLSEYYDEQRSFIIDKVFLEYYTNIKLPDKLEECYQFVCSHYDYISGMKRAVNAYQWNSILNSIELKEQIIFKKMIQRNDDLDLLLIRLNNIVGIVSDILQNTNETFKNTDITKLMQNLSKKKLSEEKVIRLLADMNNESSENEVK